MAALRALDRGKHHRSDIRPAGAGRVRAARGTALTHLLDTNSCIDHLRRGAASNVTTKLAAANPGSVVLCSVVVAELLYGAYRSVHFTRTLREVQTFCGP